MHEHNSVEDSIRVKYLRSLESANKFLGQEWQFTEFLVAFGIFDWQLLDNFQYARLSTLTLQKKSQIIDRFEWFKDIIMQKEQF